MILYYGLAVLVLLLLLLGYLYAKKEIDRKELNTIQSAIELVFENRYSIAKLTTNESINTERAVQN